MPNTLKVVKDEAIGVCCVYVCLHCGRVHTFFPFPLWFQRRSAIVFFPLISLVLLFECPIYCVHAKPIAFSMGFLLAVLSTFSCWCFNGSSVYLPNPFGKHKTNILNVHTQHGIIASFKPFVGWTKCNSIWHETSSRAIEIAEWLFVRLPSFGLDRCGNNNNQSWLSLSCEKGPKHIKPFAACMNFVFPLKIKCSP